MFREWAILQRKVAHSIGSFACKSTYFRQTGDKSVTDRKGRCVLRSPVRDLSRGEKGLVEHGLCGGYMIRSELVKLLSDANPDLSARDIDLIVTTFFDRIVEQLADGGRVELRGFGAFSIRSRESRSGRNPRTGQIVPIDAKHVPYFKPGKEIRERLNV
jgi:integration host factor subunit beta